MCDSTILGLIEKFTLEKMQAGESFTAYDITRAVRRHVGRGTDVPHVDVKQEVHGMFARQEMQSYDRKLCNLPNLPAGVDQPWVYYKDGADLTAYGLGQSVASSNPATPSSAVIAIPASLVPDLEADADSDAHNDDGTGKQSNGSFKVDSRSTICVPAKLVRDLGLSENDECFAFADPLANTVLLFKTNAPQGAGPLTSLTSYTVDCHNNVRITQSALQRAGIPGQFYDISGNNDRVVVKLFSTN
jgi:hypothetical protein